MLQHEAISYFQAKSLLTQRFHRLKPEEIAMWVFVEDLTAYVDQQLAQKFSFIPPGANSPNFADALVSTFFDRHEVENFDPDGIDVNSGGQKRLGRWLTYKQLLAHWKNKYPHEPENNFQTLIESKHNQEVALGFLRFAPASPEGSLIACLPCAPLGFARNVQHGMFQRNQVELVEKVHFGEVMPPAHPLENVLLDIEERAKKQGRSFDRKRMPGRKSEFIALLKKLNPHAFTKAPSTFDGYFDKCGCKFKQGARPDGEAFWKAIFPEQYQS